MSSSTVNQQQWVSDMSKVLRYRPDNTDGLQEIAGKLHNLCLGSRAMNITELRLSVQQAVSRTVPMLLTFMKHIENNFSDDITDHVYYKWNVYVHVWVICLNLSSPSNTPLVRPMVQDGLVDHVVSCLMKLRSYCMHETSSTRDAVQLVEAGLALLGNIARLCPLDLRQKMWTSILPCVKLYQRANTRTVVQSALAYWAITLRDRLATETDRLPKAMSVSAQTINLWLGRLDHCGTDRQYGDRRCDWPPPSTVMTAVSSVLRCLRLVAHKDREICTISRCLTNHQIFLRTMLRSGILSDKKEAEGILQTVLEHECPQCSHTFAQEILSRR